MATLTVDNRHAYVEGAPLHAQRAIARETSYLQAGYKHTAGFKTKRWDGKRKLASMLKDGRIKVPAGLAQAVADTLCDEGVPVRTVDERRRQERSVAYGWDPGCSLRPYQERAVALATTPRGTLGLVGRGILKLPPRSGKTLVTAAIVRELGARALFIVPSKYLLHQARAAIGDALQAEVGQAGDGEWEPRDVTVATVQTLCSRRGKNTKREPAAPEYTELLARSDLVVFDECFPAGTIVGDKRIEKIRIGDEVPSFDEGSRRAVSGRVVRLFKKRCVELVRVRFICGRSLVCTPNHPLYSSRGWVRADSLTEGSEVLRVDDNDGVHRLRTAGDQDQKETDRLLRSVPGGAAIGPAKEGPNRVRLVRGADPVERAPRSASGESGTGVLLETVQKEVDEAALVGNDGGDEPEARVSSDEEEQPVKETGCASEDIANAATHRTPSAVDRRQGARDDTTAASASSGANENPRRVDGRAADRRQRSLGATEVRLRGPGARGEQDGGGGGRRKPLHAQSSSVGPEKGAVLSWSRVDRVEVLEPGSDGRFGGVCPDGHVYNLEVDRFHTYTADGFVVHNCHHLSSDEWRKVVRESDAPYKIGLSATAFVDREEEAELGVIWLRACTGEVLVDLSCSDLIRQGYLVRPEIRVHAIREPDLRRRGWSTKLHRDAIYRNEHRNRKIAELACGHAAAGRRTVVVTSRLEQVGAITRLLGQTRVRFARVVGQTPQSTRDRQVSRLRRGELDALVGTVLDEGVDIPEVDAVVNAEGGADDKTTYQRLRCLTPHPGKARAYVDDFVDLTHPYFAAHSLKRLAVYRSEPEFRVAVR